MALTANDVLSDINVIRNSLVVSLNNVTVDYTSTSPPNTSINSTLTDQNGNSCSVFLGTAPLLLHSIAFVYPSAFQTNFSLYVKLNGLNIDNNSFNIPPASTSGFDYVPTGKKYLIPAGSRLDVYSYMSGSATANSSFSVLAIFQKLDTLSPSEMAQL